MLMLLAGPKQKRTGKKIIIFLHSSPRLTGSLQCLPPVRWFDFVTAKKYQIDQRASLSVFAQNKRKVTAKTKTYNNQENTENCLNIFSSCCDFLILFKSAHGEYEKLHKIHVLKIKKRKNYNFMIMREFWDMKIICYFPICRWKWGLEVNVNCNVSII